ncbi:Phosphoribosylanthranilate isomerase [Paenibacillus curdlanolyticus YK9]|uniref:N-(5'-phosphoribosyl)anthranilate isomerase n=1 Tax=Paenibacillus curdlanolyticus YK9 TaxID=717606 RepID=E0IC73_9BACL|nr:phosphoribosylanthranilate isomerase [Paenibacillus curdlanolyticus]EFM09759.1 Phosphoribosylanthranilate isomerase [Paenibacillus curdlanolyticus YK9]
MSRTRIKICGLRDRETIRSMHGLNVDAIGFVFAQSKRQVSPELASDLIEEVRAWPTASSEGTAPLAVGVFVNADLAELTSVVQTAELDVVQLHGSETPELCAAVKRALDVQVWKVFPIGRSAEEDAAGADARLQPFQSVVDAVLIDTAGGGTGEVFDWNVIRDYEEAAAKLGVPLYVAGGLHLDNVQPLVQLYRPGGVDVSSGVETEGVKDIEKISTFVRRVLEA